MVENELSHLKIIWLPPNSTSLVPPVDQEVGNALKIRVRKYVNEFMAINVIRDKKQR